MNRMMKYFQLAKHVQYERYINQYLMKMSAHAEDNVVCHYQDEYLNVVLSDTFDGQTAKESARVYKGHDTVC